MYTYAYFTVYILLCCACGTCACNEACSLVLYQCALCFLCVTQFCKHCLHWDLTHFFLGHTFSISILIHILFHVRITVDRAEISVIVCCRSGSYIDEGCYQCTSRFLHQCPISLLNFIGESHPKSQSDL